MDEPEAQENEHRATHQAKVIPPATIPAVAEEHGDQTRAAKADEAAKQNADTKIKAWFTKRRAWFVQLFSVHADRQVELILAFAIAFFALCQVIVMCSGSSQTNKLIAYARQQACAATWFAQSAQEINAKIALTEGDFAQMAQNSAASITATQEQMRLDQRPWVYVRGYTLSSEPEPNKPVTITLGIINSGKTPALDVIVKTHPAAWNRPYFVDWAKFMGKVQRGMIPPETAGFTVKTAPLIVANGLDRYNNGIVSIYVKVLITYDDTFGQPHWTTVCILHRHGRPLDEFDLCEGGNDVDKIPIPRSGKKKNPN